MSASLPADMRGPQVKTPLLLLLLLLVLATLTRTVLCQDEEEEEEQAEQVVDWSDAAPTEVQTDAPSPTSAPEASTTLATDDYGSGLHHSSTENPDISDPLFNHGAETTEDPVTVTGDEGEGLYLLIILIPAAVAVAIIGTIVCGIVICRRRNRNAKNEELQQEDPYLDGSSAEKVPMPMFEEDVPSVLELEMEELDQWMKKDEEATQS